MSKKSGFREEFIGIVETHIRNGQGRTDVAIAGLLNVRRQTVAKWRKEEPAFDQAIKNPNLRIARKVDALIEKNLDEPRIELILDGEDKVLQKKVISPSARDIEVAGKMGFGGTVEFNAKEVKNQLIEETKAVRKDIRERLFSGKLTYLEAASECNDEGIDVPELWQAREIQRILSDGRKEKLTALQIAEMIESSLLPIPKTLMLEVKKEIGAVDDEYSSMAETLGDVLALARKRRDEEKNDKKE